MKFNNTDDEEKDDFFEDGGVEEAKKPKEPQPKPDDPAYWEGEESQWEHLKVPGKPKARFWLWIAACALVIGLCIGMYLRYFSPYIEEATQYGYVDNIERRGTIFKTYEGVLIPYKALMDTTRIYNRDFIFTASGTEVATQLKRYSLEGKPVRVTYKQYHATVPWRGASKIIVTEVDTADARKILPPEFNPAK